MPKHKYAPDYTALYPGVKITGEVLVVLKQSDRKMKYMECDLKCEQPVKDENVFIIGLLPGQEDSFDRLLEKGEQFTDVAPSPEDVLSEQIEAEELRGALAQLSEDEHALIDALYFERITERDYAERIGRTQPSVNERKKRILKKLKKFIGN